MIQYMTAKEAAEKWNISQRRVSILCGEKRIEGVAMLGNMWIIPRNAEKPADARLLRNSDESGKAHPFIKWAGGKGQLIDILENNLPSDFEKNIYTYIEPFVGGGALLFTLINKYSLKNVYINDNNRALMNAFIVIRENCDKLVEVLGRIQNEYSVLSQDMQQSYYYKKRELYNGDISDNVEYAALFIFLNKTCFNGLYRVNRSGEFNVPAGRYKNPLICDGKNLYAVSEALKCVKIFSCDYRETAVYADKNTFVYIDPPYRPLNKTSSFTSYTENQFNDENQKQLADYFKLISKQGAKVLLSNSDPKNVDYNDNFFDDLYCDFKIERIGATRSINSKGDKRGNVTELLIKNY